LPAIALAAVEPTPAIVLAAAPPTSTIVLAAAPPAPRIVLAAAVPAFTIVPAARAGAPRLPLVFFPEAFFLAGAFFAGDFFAEAFFVRGFAAVFLPADFFLLADLLLLFPPEPDFEPVRPPVAVPLRFFAMLSSSARVRKGR
jgi:hypothetical protein